MIATQYHEKYMISARKKSPSQFQFWNLVFLNSANQELSFEYRIAMIFRRTEHNLAGIGLDYAKIITEKVHVISHKISPSQFQLWNLVFLNSGASELSYEYRVWYAISEN